MHIVALAYLIGSLPVAWLATWITTGKDLRQLGSGNVGVMNTALQAGRSAGLIVFLAEAVKGILVVLLARAAGLGPLMTGLAVGAAVVGTQRMVWLSGAGGRGNTCGGAALLLISPYALLAGFLVWIIVRALSGTSFSATRAALFSWPPLIAIISGSWLQAASAALICVLYLLAQRPETDDHMLLKSQGGSIRELFARPTRNLAQSLDGSDVQDDLARAPSGNLSCPSGSRVDQRGAIGNH